MSDSILAESFTAGTDTPLVPPKKRPRIEPVEDDKSVLTNSNDLTNYCPQKMYLVSVLRNDLHAKCLILHTRFEDSPEKEAIVILQKSPFPSDPKVLRNSRVIRDIESSEDQTTTELVDFPEWHAKSILTNDIYHRLCVTSGLESVNGVDMTVIHPAEPHHFKKYATSRRHLIHETPETYRSVIVPFLAEKPRDLSWVDNILAGTAEQDRVLFSNPDPVTGFTLVLDYRWNGQQLHELHCLGIAHDPHLTCLRDLNATHVPMLKQLLCEGRNRLTAKYCGSNELTTNDANNTCATEEPCLTDDQIVAYFHYPPTFYRMHVHFVHVDAAVDRGTQAGRAHLLEEVIQNLEMDGDYYAKRVMTMYLHDNSPMLAAIKASEQEKSQSVTTNDE